MIESIWAPEKNAPLRKPIKNIRSYNEFRQEQIDQVNEKEGFTIFNQNKNLRDLSVK